MECRRPAPIATRPGDITISRMSATNTSLVRRLGTVGDNDSWADFVRTYEPLVRSYVASRSHRHGVRMDDHDLNVVVQSVWIKLWEHADGFQLDKQRGRFRTYLYAVTVNALIDFVRRNRKHHIKRVPWERVDFEHVQIKPDDDWDLAYRAAIWRRIAEPLQAEIMRDNPVKWQSFELHKIQARPAKEVAAQLGIRIDLVYQNVSRVMSEARVRCLAICEEELADEQ